MSKLIALGAMLMTFNAFAARTTLLRCNIPWGELQEVSVIEDSGSYILAQLNNVGSWREYPMSKSQLKRGRIPLHLTWGDKATLIRDTEGWSYQSDSGDFYVLSCQE